MGGRVIFFGINKLEKIEIAPVGTRGADAIGGVMIFGADRLDGASACGHTPNETKALQLTDVIMDAALRVDINSGAHFLERWRDAMCREMGLDEFEKFCLSRRQRRHGPPHK